MGSMIWHVKESSGVKKKGQIFKSLEWPSLKPGHLLIFRRILATVGGSVDAGSDHQMVFLATTNLRLLVMPSPSVESGRIRKGREEDDGNVKRCKQTFIYMYFIVCIWRVY
jgi:hypothetical protein